MSDTITEARLVAAITRAFHCGAACNCQGPAKLSENDLRLALFDEGVISRAGLPDPTAHDLALDSDLVRRAIGHRDTWSLSHTGVRTLGELTAWTYQDLLALSGVGPLAVKKIELTMARFGLLLADGDPALIHQARRQRDRERGAAGRPPADGVRDPHEVRILAAEALTKLGRRALKDGGSLFGLAHAIYAGKRAVGPIKSYVTRDNGSYAQEVARACGALFALEARESARRKETKRTPARAAAPHLRVVG